MIRRQSLQTSAISYLGVGLGYINVVLLFPKLFEPEQFGLTRILIAVVGVSAQFALVGLTNTIIRFFPRFKEGDEKRHHGILGWALMSGLIGTMVLALVLLVAKPWVVSEFQDKSGLFVNFYYLLFPLLLFEICTQIFASYTRALYLSVVNVLFREFFLRAATTLLILLYQFHVIDFQLFMQLFVGQFGFMVFGLAAYLKVVGRFSLHINRSFLTPTLRKELSGFRLFTFLSSISTLALTYIDIIMITSMMGLEQTAFYSVGFYMAALLNIPKQALTNISLPVVSDAWQRNDTETIQTIYTKTSINQLLLGVLIFVGLWSNQANIFQLLPEAYSGGKWVLFFAALARLADVGFGINGGIITTSKLYRFDTYSNFVLLVVTVLLNLILIPIYGIVGAAIATAISLLSFNVSKFIFLRVKFGLSPFSWKSLAAIVLGFASFGVASLLPNQSPSLIIDMVLRSLIVLAVFVPAALVLNLSEDLTKFLKDILAHIKNS